MGSSEGALYFETRYYGLALGQAEATDCQPSLAEGALCKLHQ